jgi:hypothetical protein
LQQFLCSDSFVIVLCNVRQDMDIYDEL